LIVWGALLDCHIGLPRVVKNFTFLVPDDQLDLASATLTDMHLPLVQPQRLQVRTRGDFALKGYLHRVSVSVSPGSMQCLHLVPSSFPSYTADELQPADVEGVPVLVPRPSAVYACIVRMMHKYDRHWPEQRKLQSDLELLVNHHLLGIEKVPVDEEGMEALGLEKRVETAEETVRAWGRAGEWREGEEWVENALVGIFTNEVDIGRLPFPDSSMAG
ncbi:hypothetical protein C8R47DRAFT_995986, partial [Mycena vitilis]